MLILNLAIKVVIASSGSSSSGSLSKVIGPSSRSASSVSPVPNASSGFYLRSYQTLMPGRKASSNMIVKTVIMIASTQPSQKCTLWL